MPVTVRDKHNQIVKGLTKEDFTLTDDGHPQTIKYFNLDTNLPLTLGLLVDSSMSQRTVLDQEKTASKTFLGQMLTGDKDKAFVIHFDREVELLQDLTASRDKLSSAIDLIEVSSAHNEDASSDGSSGSGRSMRGGGTQLYDAIYLASDELMKKQPGRKALIILTDGVDRGSKETLNSAIESAQRADTEVYSIYFKGERDSGGGNGGLPGMGRHGGGFPGGGGGYPGGGYPGGGGGYPRGGGGQRPTESHVDGKKILAQISGETGGRMFEVSKKETVEQIYATIAEELRSQYVLGYTPDKTDSGAGYHKLALTTSKKDVTVQTRAGYYSDR
ncbi:von Willebrand factor, type A [Acidisarcina polymorpha]|uniref:von Willebrand factor, type A n=2 Tax=Acidisarcina polymorpha TaxID=2211140 RepID=A0A2Z5FYA6_9BACT|nr:von Willebrand factor, type A [Acidisarcina polymorpha]